MSDSTGKAWMNAHQIDEKMKLIEDEIRALPAKRRNEKFERFLVHLDVVLDARARKVPDIAIRTVLERNEIKLSQPQFVAFLKAAAVERNGAGSL